MVCSIAMIFSGGYIAETQSGIAFFVIALQIVLPVPGRHQISAVLVRRLSKKYEPCCHLLLQHCFSCVLLDKSRKTTKVEIVRCCCWLTPDASAFL